jgi:hypothetical protein
MAKLHLKGLCLKTLPLKSDRIRRNFKWAIEVQLKEFIKSLQGLDTALEGKQLSSLMLKILLARSIISRDFIL